MKPALLNDICGLACGHFRVNYAWVELELYYGAGVSKYFHLHGH